MTRKQYRLELAVLVSLDEEQLKDVEEQLKDVEEQLKGRVNEMLSQMERHDDVRIDLLLDCEVTEVA